MIFISASLLCSAFALSDQCNIPLLVKLPARICKGFQIVDIYAHWLWLPVEFSIPACIYIAALKHFLSPPVEDSEAFKCSLPASHHFDCLVWKGARGESIWHIKHGFVIHKDIN